jgi:hypothetical protein
MSYYVIRRIHPRGRSARADEADIVALTLAAATDNVVLGPYLEWSDPNAKFGRGDDGWTFDLARAKRFPSVEAAMKCWKAQSTLVPYRPDGKPNRPMTAYSVTMQEIPE